MSSRARASTCLPTPPGYVYEYGETSAMRTGATLMENSRSVTPNFRHTNGRCGLFSGGFGA